MNLNNFLKRNIYQISKGGFPIIIKKIITLINFFFSIPIYIFSIPVLICLYLIRSKYLCLAFNCLSSQSAERCLKFLCFEESSYLAGQNIVIEDRRSII